MQRLGYTRYVAQGGDWGNAVSELMALQQPPGLVGIHTNMAATVPANISKALAFHEALHNLFPNQTVHSKQDPSGTAFGGGIAAAHIPDQDPNEDNKAFLRRGFSVRTQQLL